MKTLKECIDIAKLFDGDDMYAIRLYLSQDDTIDTAVKLLAEVSYEQTIKLKLWKSRVKGNMSIPSYYHHSYNKETASMLDALTRKMQLGYEFDEHDKEWMRNFEVKIKEPMWHDLYEAIKQAKDETYKPQYYNYIVDKEI